MPEPDAALAEAPAPEPAVAEAPPTAKAPAAPKAPKGKDKKGKDKKGKDKAPQVLGDAPSIAAHPRAARSVAQAKAWGALIGFTLGGYLSLPTHTLADAGLRALAAGAVLYVAAWAGAVFAWRRLVMIEIKAREAQVLAAVQTARERQSAGAGGQGARGRPGAGMP